MARPKGSRNRPKTIQVPLAVLTDVFKGDQLIPVGREIAEFLTQMGKSWEIEEKGVIKTPERAKNKLDNLTLGKPDEDTIIEKKLVTWD